MTGLRATPRVYLSVAQPADGGAPVTAITTVHKDDFDSLETAVATALERAESPPWKLLPHELDLVQSIVGPLYTALKEINGGA